MLVTSDESLQEAARAARESKANGNANRSSDQRRLSEKHRRNTNRNINVKRQESVTSQLQHEVTNGNGPWSATEELQSLLNNENHYEMRKEGRNGEKISGSKELTTPNARNHLPGTTTRDDGDPIQPDPKRTNTRANGGAKKPAASGLSNVPSLSAKLAANHRYYRKAILLMIAGGVVFIIGIAMAVLYFQTTKDIPRPKDKKQKPAFGPILMIGPICLAVGLLLGVCGAVWIPLIKTKLKRKAQMNPRNNFAL